MLESAANGHPRSHSKQNTQPARGPLFEGFCYNYHRNEGNYNHVSNTITLRRGY